MARQELVRRLDHYQHRCHELFGQVVRVLEAEFVPVIRRHACASLFGFPAWPGRDLTDSGRSQAIATLESLCAYLCCPASITVTA
jgi:hypothetical protein